ncbi:hypothetical protein [Chryseolinea lacunae]|uniref:Uncharacterized protein n=1 Tax=Chryseolinea lacunae TaxID=2801331 RepID=A0ABS1L1P3_9BACT|nr:hypothetical protein [Chryseolinea lacunae]MBL0745363.1 hypothetical protein [Chryseolinea lacunae]
MKKINSVAIIFIAIVLSGCGKRDDVESAGNSLIEIHLPKQMHFRNAKVIRHLKEYIESDSSRQFPKVYQLLVEEKDFKTTITINSTIYYDALVRFSVVGYFLLDGNVVVVRSRLGSLYDQDAAFLQQLKDFLSANNISDAFFEEPGFTYDSQVWRVEIVDDSVSLEKGVRNPDVRYVGKIDFTLPK